MEIKHCTTLTCSILYVFLVSFAKDISTTASSFSHQVNNHEVLLHAPADIANENIFGTEHGKIQLQNIKQATENMENADALKGLRTSESADTKTWRSANGVRRKRWAGLSTWGKRDPEVTGVSNNFPDILDNESPNKRKWSAFSSWGKRYNANSFGDSADKRWREMSVWGKRDDGTDKRWKEMSVWGKRDNIENLKKWKEMSVWGKRQDNIDKSWGETALWGKGKPQEPIKKWKPISAWGKRTSDDQIDKKWKDMAVWGKREGKNINKILDNEYLMDKEKEKFDDKKWKEMAVWGKRRVQPLGLAKLDDIGLWGKRSFKHMRNWRDMDMWGKRPSWSKTGFTSWGKRSDDVDTVSE